MQRHNLCVFLIIQHFVVGQGNRLLDQAVNRQHVSIYVYILRTFDRIFPKIGQRRQILSVVFGHFDFGQFFQINLTGVVIIGCSATKKQQTQQQKQVVFGNATGIAALYCEFPHFFHQKAFFPKPIRLKTTCLPFPRLRFPFPMLPHAWPFQVAEAPNAVEITDDQACNRYWKP
ncbi:hypothetical protein SDC9_193105 [bioreactor metagenome]|uniref:Uncharacterized protein n=1 Tax=bioreactor metagenome TaxID=1076179 RepID=A0A645I2R2_9ZZZZ